MNTAFPFAVVSALSTACSDKFCIVLLSRSFHVDNPSFTSPLPLTENTASTISVFFTFIFLAISFRKTAFQPFASSTSTSFPITYVIGVISILAVAVSVAVFSPDLTVTVTETVTSPNSLAVITASTPSVSIVAAVPSIAHVTLSIVPVSTDTDMPAVSANASSVGADSIVAFTISASFFTTRRFASACTVNSFPSTVTFTSAVTVVSPSATPVTTAFVTSSLSAWTVATAAFSTDHCTAVTSPALVVTSATASSSSRIAWSRTKLTSGSSITGFED